MPGPRSVHRHRGQLTGGGHGFSASIPLDDGRAVELHVAIRVIHGADLNDQIPFLRRVKSSACPVGDHE